MTETSGAGKGSNVVPLKASGGQDPRLSELLDSRDSAEGAFVRQLNESGPTKPADPSSPSSADAVNAYLDTSRGRWGDDLPPLRSPSLTPLEAYREAMVVSMALPWLPFAMASQMTLAASRSKMVTPMDIGMAWLKAFTPKS